ncbi:hypothetical protein O5O45_19480 [Hahella aquimaris]|uniref:hypothetical protein n=1 Tax=Hahella sp. HNIBRBA332 TaxID=3015983 RepID=UPI00273C1AC0|nr:hypothetical protein [Hahella sp. HNIBRBA332]WLQ11913.1 hypothetical protein O5O45_19480 [Hahella sp. HNIBRBA332]
MRLLTLKLRTAKKPCVPIGPDFGKAEAIELDLSGAKIKLQLNPHQPSSSHEEEIAPDNSYNLYDDSLYEEDETGLFRFFRLLKRCWGFRGPIFSGYVAELGATLVVKRAKPGRQDYSLLNAQDFQQFITDADYGDEVLFGRSLYDAPVDWAPANVGGNVPAVTFEVRSGPVRGRV